MKRFAIIFLLCLLAGQVHARKYERLFLWVDETINVTDRNKLLAKIKIAFHDNIELPVSKLPRGRLKADPARVGRYVAFNIEVLKHKWTKAQAQQWVLNNISEPGKVKAWLGDSPADTGIEPIVEIE